MILDFIREDLAQRVHGISSLASKMLNNNNRQYVLMLVFLQVSVEVGSSFMTVHDLRVAKPAFSNLIFIYHFIIFVRK